MLSAAVSAGLTSAGVDVLLVDIRAWDTLGEISVLLVAATGVASASPSTMTGLPAVAAPMALGSLPGVSTVLPPGAHVFLYRDLPDEVVTLQRQRTGKARLLLSRDWAEAHPRTLHLLDEEKRRWAGQGDRVLDVVLVQG